MDKSKLQPISLKDLMGDDYEIDTYLSKDDIAVIREVFKDKNVLKVVRKVLLPTVADPAMPIEEMVGKDVWNFQKDWGVIPVDEIKSLIVARQEAIKFVADGLMKLKALANVRDETLQEREARLKKDSNK